MNERPEISSYWNYKTTDYKVKVLADKYMQILQTYNF